MRSHRNKTMTRFRKSALMNDCCRARTRVFVDEEFQQGACGLFRTASLDTIDLRTPEWLHAGSSVPR